MPGKLAEQAEVVLDALDGSKAPSRVHTRRQNARYSYRHNLKLEVSRDTEPPLLLWVFPRDLNSDGIGVLTAEPLSVERAVFVDLIAQDGTIDRVPGRVVYSREAERYWYLVGIKFESPVDPTRYV